MPRPAARARLGLAATLALILPTFAAGPVAACTGPPAEIADIVSTARAIVVARLVGVDVEADPDKWLVTTERKHWVFEAEQVLRGDIGTSFSLSEPISTSVCTGFHGVVGDRMVLAVEAISFSRTTYPYWPLEVFGSRDSYDGARTDLDNLLGAIDRSIGRPPAASGEAAGGVIVAFAVLGLIATVAFGRTASAKMLQRIGRGRRASERDL